MKDKKHRLKRPILLMIILILIVALVIAIIYSANHLTESYYHISSSKLPAAFDGYRIVQISDLHNKEFGADNSRLIERIDKFSPDIVVMTGDMLSRNSKNFDGFLPTATALSVYYIVGNHEQAFAEEKLAELYCELANLGVNVLDNQMVELHKGTESIDLYGLWYNLRYYSSFGNDYVQDDPDTYILSAQTIANILATPDVSRFNLLLAHNPVFFDAYQQWGADLTLCGHIHGGMVRLPGVGGVFGPTRTLFPQYDAGLYSRQDQHMIVSRGLGRGIFGFRLFNPPDLVMITLHQD